MIGACADQVACRGPGVCSRIVDLGVAAAGPESADDEHAAVSEQRRGMSGPGVRHRRRGRPCVGLGIEHFSRGKLVGLGLLAAADDQHPPVLEDGASLVDATRRKACQSRPRPDLGRRRRARRDRRCPAALRRRPRAAVEGPRVVAIRPAKQDDHVPPFVVCHRRPEGVCPAPWRRARGRELVPA